MELILGKMKIGNIVSFELALSGIVKNRYENVKVVGIIPAYLADKFGEDVYTLHAQVYSALPPGTMPDNAESYQYLIVENPNKTTSVVGLPWIDVSTIRVFIRSETKFIIQDMAQEDIDQISRAISRLGYTPVIEKKNF